MIDLSSMTQEQIKAINERVWRNGELDYADKVLNKIADGQVTEDPSAWRAYRVALRQWPDAQGFPDQANRPRRPGQ